MDSFDPLEEAADNYKHKQAAIKNIEDSDQMFLVTLHSGRFKVIHSCITNQLIGAVMVCCHDMMNDHVAEMTIEDVEDEDDG